jgi:hypothetical protein
METAARQYSGAWILEVSHVRGSLHKSRQIFFAKNIAAREMEYTYLNAHEMYF